MTRVEITTKDGICPCYVYRPVGSGPWPAVLVFMDGLGIRPAMLEIGERLATYGYFVLLPDLFYRSGSYEPMDPHTVFTDPEKRKVLMEKFFALATPANIMSDTSAFLEHVAAERDVKPGGIGTTGYCMGGLMSLTAAGTYPDRIVAAASYHGGRLASDAPDSPHRLALRIKARVYVAGAIEDASFPEEQKLRLEKALTDAGVTHVVVIGESPEAAARALMLVDAHPRLSATAGLHLDQFRAEFGALIDDFPNRNRPARRNAGLAPDAERKRPAVSRVEENLGFALTRHDPRYMKGFPDAEDARRR